MSDVIAPPSIHEPSGVQHYAAQIAWLASALAADESLAAQLIEAIHSESAARVERVFRSIGVDAPTTISTTETSGDSTHELARVSSGGTTKTTEVTVTIGFGRLSVSVTVTKTSKTS